MVARAGYDAMMKGRTDVVTGLKNKLQTAMASVLPANITAEMHRRQAQPGTGRPKAQRDGASGDGFAVKALLGAAAGVAGVWALDGADWFMWNREDLDSRAKTIKARPRQLPPAENLVSAVTEAMGRELPHPAFDAASQAVHYSFGVAPAIGYALLRDRLPVDGVARGALYGVGMFLAQDEVLNTVTGLGSKPRDYPWQAHARGLIAHTIYGIATELALNVLEGWTNRRDERQEQPTPMMTRGREERLHVVH